MDDFTSILTSASSGDRRSAEALLPLVYEELRRLAYARMAGESAAHTLQPTALVHEAWLRMVQQEDRTWQNRAYFFSSAANAMRRILVDHARKKSTSKHGGDQQRFNIDDLDIAKDGAEEKIQRVDDALKYLEQVHPDWARIVVMKYFGGMTNDEVAQALEISESTVRRYWKSAKIWLYKQMVS